jgi:hypothetical protein
VNATIAPWLNINPMSFVEAAKAGADIGQRESASKRNARTALAEAAMRNATAMAGIGEHQANAAAALAQERDLFGQKAAMGGRELDYKNRALTSLEQNRADVNAINQQRADTYDEYANRPRPKSALEALLAGGGGAAAAPGVLPSPAAPLALQPDLGLPSIPAAGDAGSALAPDGTYDIFAAAKRNGTMPGAAVKKPVGSVVGVWNPQTQTVDPYGLDE